MDMKTKLLINAGLVVSVCGLLVFAGCSHDPNRSAGRVLDDHKVAGKVKGALDDSPVYKFPHVKVTTYNGVVQLSGFVQSEEQKREAAQVARHTSGVTDVIKHQHHSRRRHRRRARQSHWRKRTRHECAFIND